MIKQFQRLETKKQLMICLEFIAGYFSPLIGIIIFIWQKYKKHEKLNQYAPLCGAGLALLVYVIQFVIYLITTSL